MSNSNKLVFIDESGYTGADLLNAEQPIQAASAVFISDTEAELLIRKHFPRLQSPELKHKDLVRRPNNWNRLLSLQNDLLKNHLCITYVCDKKFLLILMFLDSAVEPFYYEKGFNFYEDGQNYALASLLFFTGDALLGANQFTEILNLFQLAVKAKTQTSIQALIDKVCASNWQEFPEVFGPLATQNQSCIDAIIDQRVSTDIAHVVLMSLINRLEAELNHGYRIVHDQSENLKQYDHILYKMINHSQHIEFFQSKLASIKFPLKLESVSQIDSRMSPGVQLADILAGAAVDAMKSLQGLKSNEYSSSIFKQYSEPQLIHLLPKINFEEQKEFRKGTEASKSIDYIAQLFK
ncbi:DUF3800 domain-containing protein [Pseudoalteromonas sp. Isolate3]|uniref:DUF3800 domain-containing protein n=1 Tax=Pseudoalteromonas sp. Isolate3 TaxID=2908526 RepID=UPI001EFCF249|nr:DUF3800 domain-containing protein [Pseudoalteromonas sp. Isolate3]MCG9708720.1 DUF3800 domain-containing protein [Pseudoalteromonas sp. Isolate3]